MENPQKKTLQLKYWSNEPKVAEQHINLCPAKPKM